MVHQMMVEQVRKPCQAQDFCVNPARCAALAMCLEDLPDLF
jgi:hypothetical protein